MQVVCLILGPMLASQLFSHAFWVLTFLHLLSFLLKMFFIIFVDCRNTGVSYISYKIIQSNVCSSMQVSLLHISIIYVLIIILFHLQKMSILYFPYSTVCSPTSSVSHCVNHSVFECLS